MVNMAIAIEDYVTVRVTMVIEIIDSQEIIDLQLTIKVTLV